MPPQRVTVAPAKGRWRVDGPKREWQRGAVPNEAAGRPSWRVSRAPHGHAQLDHQGPGQQTETERAYGADPRPPKE
jgi:hypothetical protein